MTVSCATVASGLGTAVCDGTGSSVGESLETSFEPPSAFLILFSVSSCSNKACQLLPSSILSKRLSLLLDATRSIRHSLLARAVIASCLSSSVLAISMANSSSAMSLLKESADGMENLWAISDLVLR